MVIGSSYVVGNEDKATDTIDLYELVLLDCTQLSKHPPQAVIFESHIPMDIWTPDNPMYLNSYKQQGQKQSSLCTYAASPPHHVIIQTIHILPKLCIAICKWKLHTTTNFLGGILPRKIQDGMKQDSEKK